MKTNRYITQPTNFQPRVRQPTFDKHSRMKSPEEKATLKTLVSSFNPCQSYTLSCNKKLGLYITSIFEHTKLPRSKSNSQLTNKLGTLKQLFRKYLLEPKKAIVFKAATHHHLHYAVHSEQQAHKNYTSLCKTASEGQLDLNRQSHESNRKNNFSNKFTGQSFAKDRWLSNEKHKQVVDNRKLMTVQEVKQSSHSEAQQSENEHCQEQKKPSKYNFSEVHSNFKFNKNIVKKQQPFNKKGTSQQFDQQKAPEVQRKPLQSLANHNFENNKNKLEIPNNINVNIQPQANQNNSQRLSFGSEIRKGLIQNDSFEPGYQNSLKVAGDKQIEKQLNHRMNSNEASQISELSSIISTGRHEGMGYPPMNNSLKNDIEIIDYESRSEVEKKNEGKEKENAFYKKDNRYVQMGAAGEQQKVQKINLTSIAQKREANVDENIEITEKQHAGQQPQFLVKYNLRFLQKKNTATEVVRLSPLRFRAKQQTTNGGIVVHQGKTS